MPAPQPINITAVIATHKNVANALFFINTEDGAVMTFLKEDAVDNLDGGYVGMDVKITADMTASETDELCDDHVLITGLLAIHSAVQPLRTDIDRPLLHCFDLRRHIACAVCRFFLKRTKIFSRQSRLTL